MKKEGVCVELGFVSESIKRVVFGWIIRFRCFEEFIKSFCLRDGEILELGVCKLNFILVINLLMNYKF